MQGAARRPSLTYARHLGLLVHSTRANQHRFKTPHLLWWCVHRLNPRTQSAVTYRGCLWGGSRGEGVNLPILYGHLPSDHAFFQYRVFIGGRGGAPSQGFLRVPILRSLTLRGD